MYLSSCGEGVDGVEGSSFRVCEESKGKNEASHEREGHSQNPGQQKANLPYLKIVP